MLMLTGDLVAPPTNQRSQVVLLLCTMLIFLYYNEEANDLMTRTFLSQG